MKLNGAKVTIARPVKQSLLVSSGKSLAPRFAEFCEIELSHLEDELELFANEKSKKRVRHDN